MKPIASEVLKWFAPEDWTLGTTCLILCRGASPPTDDYKGQVSEHYGMASLPQGTIAWAPMPFPKLRPGFV